MFLVFSVLNAIDVERPVSYTHLVPILNVYENIVLPGELDGDTADQRFMDNIVNMLGLDDKLNNMPNQMCIRDRQSDEPCIWAEYRDNRAAASCNNGA